MNDTTLISNPSSEVPSALLDPAAGRGASGFETSDFPPQLNLRRRPAQPITSEASHKEVGVSNPGGVLCTRVQEALRAGEALEQGIWTVLSFCAAATILYAAYCFFLQG